MLYAAPPGRVPVMQGSVVRVAPRSGSIRARAKPKDDEEGDIIERFVSKLFGKQALQDQNPGGLARLDNPEMYYAPVDKFAEPLPSDTGDIRHYRQLLADTQLEKTPLVKVFDTEVDGWGMEAFGKRLYTLGATLVVVKLASGEVCGGYNPSGWIGLGEDRNSMAAFLFCWPNGKVQERPIKLAKRGGAALSVLDYVEKGICFAPDGLACMVPGNEKVARSKLGPYYDVMPGGAKTLFNDGKKQADVERIMCYCSADGPETYELDGIVWKTGRG